MWCQTPSRFRTLGVLRRKRWDGRVQLQAVGLRRDIHVLPGRGGCFGIGKGTVRKREGKRAVSSCLQRALSIRGGSFRERETKMSRKRGGRHLVLLSPRPGVYVFATSLRVKRCRKAVIGRETFRRTSSFGVCRSERDK